jgi:hypothetical protein
VPIYTVSVIALDDRPRTSSRGKARPGWPRGDRLSACRPSPGALVPGRRLRRPEAGGGSDLDRASTPIPPGYDPRGSCPFRRVGALHPQGGPHPQRLRSGILRLVVNPGGDSPEPCQGGHRETARNPRARAGVALSGCAKKSYVQREVSEVNESGRSRFRRREDPARVQQSECGSRPSTRTPRRSADKGSANRP